MSDQLDNLIDKIKILSVQIYKISKQYYYKILFEIEKISRKGVLRFEVEKMKRELKNIYNQLGNYIIDKNLKNPVTDFSHDPDFLEFIDKANKIKLCIKEIKLNRDVKVTN